MGVASALGKLFFWGATGSVAGYTGYCVYQKQDIDQRLAQRPRFPLRDPAPREAQIAQLRSGKQRYDVLVIGGGATGAGIALDAATRGLSCALVERGDFASGTSSRSTKLIHGGVRYLEKGVIGLLKMQPDAVDQLKLVFEALHERKNWFRIAPHLSNALPLITPCYRWWEVPFYYAGLKMYDLIAGVEVLHMSRLLSPSESIRNYPMLASKRCTDGASLKASVVYFDGQMNDSRMNVGLALTAAGYGAHVANHVRVVNLLKQDPENPEKVTGALVRDELSGDEFSVNARVVINAAGPFVDAIRHMDVPDSKDMIAPSAGVHIVLPAYFSPDSMGLLIPKTKDGRVVFMLPWQGHTLAGTTDSPSGITDRPQPSEADIQFILEAIAQFVRVDVRRSDVTAAWSGIRPLARPTRAAPEGSTASIARDHIIEVDDKGSQMITISGGKWTTYRLMAEQAVDTAIRVGQLQATAPCVTMATPLIGSHRWTPISFATITQKSIRSVRRSGGDNSTTTSLVSVPVPIAKHLSGSYGDQADLVLEIARDPKFGYGTELVEGHPILEAEVIYACRREYARRAVDVLAHRTRLAFLDAGAAIRALPRVIELMAAELNWSEERRVAESRDAMAFLQTMSPAAEAPAVTAA